MAAVKIELEKPYKSIRNLECGDLPDFVVLVGRNGTGKTQILEALDNGSAAIPGAPVEDTLLYNAATFAMHDPGQGDRSSDSFVRATAQKYLSPPSGFPPVDHARYIFEQYIQNLEDRGVEKTREDYEADARQWVRQIPDFPTSTDLPGSGVDLGLGFLYGHEIRNHVLRLLDNSESRGHVVSRPHRKIGDLSGNAVALICTAAKLSGKLFHELTHEDFVRASDYGGHILHDKISAVFATYKLNQIDSAYRQAEASQGHINFSDFIRAYEESHPPPWKVLRETLTRMRDAAGDDRTFNFDFSDPSGEIIGLDRYHEFTFTTKMTNLATGTIYDPASLSSGEKILMAVCLAYFNNYLGRRRPKLLLLDELDSVLHPSMVVTLVHALKDLFVAQGTKVIMTTHSPVTVATLDEADIFRVNRVGRSVTISSVEKSEAVAELSEGIATVDAGLRIATFQQSNIVVLTEGNNTKHLKRWAELFFPDFVSVFEGLEAHTGKKRTPPVRPNAGDDEHGSALPSGVGLRRHKRSE